MLPSDLTLGYCWKCLAEERDPRNVSMGSLWWSTGFLCRCVHPDLRGNWCVACGQARYARAPHCS
jgi:hypothetical protein